MALDAVISIKGIFAFAVAGTAGLAFFHVGHGCLGAADAVREDLGVAVGALVGLQVELVTEGGITSRLGDHVVDNARLKAFVALGTVTGNRKDIGTIVAGTAGFPFSHVGHGVLSDFSLVGEYPGVAVLAGVGSGVDIMTECGLGHTLELENNILGIQASVTLGAVAGCGKHVLAVVAGTAGFSFSHVGHCGFSDYGTEGEYLRMTLPACESSGVDFMAESCRADTLGFEYDIFWIHATLVAFITVACYAESLFAVVACTTGPPFFHLIHGDGFFLAGDDGAVVTAFARPPGLGNMERVAEHGVA